MHLKNGMELILSRDMDFSMLIQDQGSILNPNGYRIMCQDSRLSGVIVGHMNEQKGGDTEIKANMPHIVDEDAGFFKGNIDEFHVK